jgi:hypothetical protein
MKKRSVQLTVIAIASLFILRALWDNEPPQLVTASPLVSVARVVATPAASIMLYLPAIEAAAMPSAQETYRQQLAAWMLDAKQWASDLSALFDAGLSTTSPEWIATLDSLEQQAIALTTSLNALQPPQGYVNAHEMLRTSMEACTDAIGHFQAGEFGFGELSLTVCTGGFMLATDKMR